MMKLINLVFVSVALLALGLVVVAIETPESLQELYQQVFSSRSIDAKQVLIILSRLNDELSREENSDEDMDFSPQDIAYIKTLISACTIRDHHCTRETFDEYQRLWMAETNENAKSYLRHCESVQLSFCVRNLSNKIKHEASDIEVKEREDMSDLLRLVYKIQPVQDELRPNFLGKTLVVALVKYLRSKSIVKFVVNEEIYEKKLDSLLFGMCENIESILGPTVDDFLSITKSRKSVNMDDLLENWVNSVRICRRIMDKSNGILRDVYVNLKEESCIKGKIKCCFKGVCTSDRYGDDN